MLDAIVLPFGLAPANGMRCRLYLVDRYLAALIVNPFYQDIDQPVPGGISTMERADATLQEYLHALGTKAVIFQSLGFYLRPSKLSSSVIARRTF